MTIKQCNRLSYTPLGILYQVWKSHKDMKTILLSIFPARVHCIIEKRRTWISKCSEYWECHFIFCWCTLSTNNQILTTIRHLHPATSHLPPSHTTCCTPPSMWRLQFTRFHNRVSRSILWTILSNAMWSISPFNSVLGSIQCSRLRVCHLVWLEAQLTVYLGVYLRICSGVYFRVTWRCPLTILGVVLQSALWGALSNSLRADLGVYSQVGWEFTMKGIVTLHESMIGRVYESVLEDIQWSLPWRAL